MIWLTPQNLTELGVSRRQLNDGRSLWTWKTTGERGRNGKPIRMVLLESMQPKWIEKWLQTGPQASRLPDDIGSLTTEPLPDSPSEIRASEGDALDTETRQKAGAEDQLTRALVRYRPEIRNSLLAEAERLASIIERFNAIKPKQLRDSKGKLTPVQSVLDLCAETPCTVPEILAIEPARGKARSVRTLYIWATDYEAIRLAAFLRKPPSRQSVIDKRRAPISAEAEAWINANFKTKASAERLYKDCKKEAAKRGWTIPARGWFWRKYKSIPQVTRTLIYGGQKAYTGKYAPYVPRDYRDLAALQILCGDHSVRDVTVMLPDGSLTRPWLTLWQDLRTGLIWGWHLDLTPSSITIGLAYASGVQTFGAQPLSRPETDFYSYLYTDQGKDYRCKQLTGQTLEFRDLSYGRAALIEGGLNNLCTQRRVGLMDELGVKHLMARGYNAREKFIERTHKDISAWEQNTFENEYCGRGIGHKPERWKSAWQRHQKLLKKTGMHPDWLASESPFMTLDDYRDTIAGWITEYNQSEHTRVVLGGATIVPIREYERLYTTRYDIDDQTLALLLLRAAKRKIGKNGIQFFQSHFYYLHEEMSEFKGREVEVRHDDDYTRIWVHLPNGRTVEAPLVTSSGVLNPNKQTMAMVARQRAKELAEARNYQLVQQSNWRGETVEHRVQAMLGVPDTDGPEQEKIAVNAQPRVPLIGRFDRAVSAARPSVTPEMIEGANVIEGLFGRSASDDKCRIKEEWED